MFVNDNHIVRIAGGDLESFKRLYFSVFPLLCVYAYRIVKDESETKDIVQESLLTYWKNRTQFDNIDSVKAYLYSITKNRSLNIVRDKKISDRYYDYSRNFTEREWTNDMIIENEVYFNLHKAITKLPEQTRKVIKMSMDGFKNQEIAEDLEVSVNTVKTLKKIGYSYLRNILSRIILFIF
jgi:RNA polymerase sigma-70 factor (ECF subfamily)